MYNLKIFKGLICVAEGYRGVRIFYAKKLIFKNKNQIVRWFFKIYLCQGYWIPFHIRFPNCSWVPSKELGNLTKVLIPLTCFRSFTKLFFFLIQFPEEDDDFSWDPPAKLNISCIKYAEECQQSKLCEKNTTFYH